MDVGTNVAGLGTTMADGEIDFGDPGRIRTSDQQLRRLLL
jgi:hypothetical protein